MREPLQNGAPPSYERPNQPWVCGLAADGRACPSGPTAHGVCPALAECAPIRDGDRWICNRSTLRGGPCDEGPSPEGACCRINRCHPVRSLRAKRGRFVFACTLLSAAALLMLLSARSRDTFISPGPLATSHAQLLEADGSPQQCAACHAAANDSPSTWVVSLVSGHGDAPTQSQLCTNCHAKTIDVKLAVAAHNLPTAELATLTLAHGGTASAAPTKACAACHQEHNGAMHDLTAISNDGCQACHTQRYDSFADDHPDFGAWPYERRTRIAFDHAAHQNKHFVEKHQAFACRQCHVEDATGRVELLTNYDAACASCHNEKIDTSVAQGVPMLSLPTLDVAAFRSAGINIGTWPEKATGDFDGRLPPTMKLLLVADPAAAQAIAILGADFEFADIDPKDAKQVRAAADIALAIKKLLAELSQTGPAAVRARLTGITGHDPTDIEIDALLSGLSPDTVRSATAAWLPGENVGTGEWNAAELKPSPSPSLQGRGSTVAFDPAGAWTRDDATFTIRYRLAAHADPVMCGWLNMAAAAASARNVPVAAAAFKEIAKPTARGLCASCHSAEQSAASQLMVNWRSSNRGNEPRAFTKFTHGPHLLLPQLADCTSCHALAPTVNTSVSYADWNPRQFTSEFQPIAKQACAACHTAKAAGDSCQSCHNYHVEQIEPWRVEGVRSRESGAREKTVDVRN